MWGLEWDLVSGDDFEELVFQLLEYLNFTNRNWYRGGTDRGRDIRAETREEHVPGHPLTQEWIIECKRHRGPISVDDLQASVAWAEVHEPDYYLVVTTSHLTPATKDWLERKNDRMRTRFQYIEGSVLTELVTKHEPPKYLALLEQQVGEPAGAHHALLSRMSAALARDDLTLGELSREIFGESSQAPFGPVPAVSLSETHEVVYSDDGMSHTRYTMRIANVGAAPVDHDTFRLYADVPVANARMNLVARQGRRSLDDIRFTFDNQYVKLIDFYLVQPLAPLAETTYRFEFDWPVPMPLEQSRHYSTYGRRPKKRVTLRVAVPDGHVIRSVLPLVIRDGASRRIEARAVEEYGAFEVSYGPLRYREQLLTTFVIEGK